MSYGANVVGRAIRAVDARISGVPYGGRTVRGGNNGAGVAVESLVA